MKNETYRLLPNSLTIKQSEINGLGLFTVVGIPKDTLLGITAKYFLYDPTK